MSDAQFLTFESGGFPLGLDWSTSPENIPDGALVQAEQCEYDHADGSLRTVEGVVIKFDAGVPVETMFYDHKNAIYLFSSGNSLYKTDLATKTLVGTLTGSSKPIYCSFGDVVLIASGGLLQTLSGGSTLTTINGSPPVSHYVTGRQGRVVAFSLASDVVNYSSIGDYTNWTNTSNDPSSGQFLDVGYKDPGNVIAVDFLAQVLLVYKAYGRAYQVIGEPGESGFSCLMISETASCLSANATCNVDGKSYYVGQAGFMSLTPTDRYSKIEPTESGLNINAWIARNIDSNCRLWHVQSKKQIWCKTQADKRVYLYHYIPRYSDGRGAWTARQFSIDLNDVCCVGSSVYVAYGNKIGLLSKTTDLDDAMQIQTVIKGQNKLARQHNIVVMNWLFVSNNILPGSGVITVGKKQRNITFTASSPKVYGNKTKVYGNKTKVYASAYSRLSKVGGGAPRNVQLALLVTKGAISLRKFDYTYIEV